jgi:hypothetical protein
MKLNTLFTAALVLILVAACSSLEISQTYDEEYNFSDLKTYNWKTALATVAEKSTRSPMLVNPFTEQKIRRAVERELTAKGFKKQETNPDFLIDYVLGVQSRRVNSYRRYMIYDEGSLVLDFLSARTNKLIWRGRAADWIEGTDIANEASINEIVKQMLARFPPS